MIKKSHACTWKTFVPFAATEFATIDFVAVISVTNNFAATNFAATEPESDQHHV